MKKSQNFTTPKQSQRLLELGIPADSADMYFQNGQTRPIVRFANSEGFFERNDDCSPCWSVGQLIEIYLTCTLEYHPYDDFYTETPSLHFMAFDKDRLIEEVIEIISEDKMDFSKLKE